MKINKYTMEMRGIGRLPYRVREDTIEFDKHIKWDTPSRMARLVNKFYNLSRLPEEHMVVVMLNSKGDPVGVFEVSHGTAKHAVFTPREILQRVLISGCNYFILAHNHPSGDPMPSGDDLDSYDKIKKAAEIVGVNLIDFLIIGKHGKYISLTEEYSKKH